MFYILSGEPTLEINGVDYKTVPGDTFICSPGDIHAVKNHFHTDTEILVFKINYPEDSEDTEWGE
jgi:quercetin dioxygenase-like cupin family protein